MRIPFRRRELGEAQRANWPALTLDDWIGQTSFANLGSGMVWPLLQSSTAGVNPQEEPPLDYYGYVGWLQQAYRTNGVVFACILARMLHFSEARFAFQEINNGRPGNLIDGPDLQVLEHPWPKGSTGDLLARAILDIDLAGNHYVAREGNRLYRLRPDWVTIILGSNSDPDRPGYAWDCDVLGYYYCPPQAPEQEKAFLAADVAHWAPIPDPTAHFRGVSWLTAAIREVIADNAMTTHQRKYFEQGATSNMVVTFDPTVSESAFKRWVAAVQGEAEGMLNAYKIIWLGGGATPHTIGNGLQDFRTVRGHGETRIAADAGVPPILVGLSEGLQSATYSNYAQARRHFGDSTLRWLWRTYAQALEDIINTPGRSRLWYDLRDVAFMRQDEADAAAIMYQEAQTIRLLTDGGWEPDSVRAAVLAKDWSLLKSTGLLSVQLQPPGTPFKPSKPAALPPAGGTGNGAIVPSQGEMQKILAAIQQQGAKIDSLNGNGNGRRNGSPLK